MVPLEDSDKLGSDGAQVVQLEDASSGITAAIATNGAVSVQSPIAELGDPTLEKPTLISGKTSTGAGTYEKRAVTVETAYVDSYGNDRNAMLTRDMNRWQASVSGTITGTGTIDSGPAFGCVSYYILVSGTWSGSITAKASYPTPQVALPLRSVGSPTQLSSITANGLYLVEEGVIDSVQLAGVGVTGTASIFMISSTDRTGSHSWQAGTWTVGINGTVPLPTGAATESTLAALNAKVTAVNTGAVVVSSSALPTGAAADATLSALSAKLPATLGQKAMTASLSVVVSSDQASFPVAATLNAETTKVIGTVNVSAGQTIGVTGTFWQATQPVSGTVTVNAGTNLNTSALALDATLTGRTQKSQITDGTRDGTVKAASTAALATDTAVVVAISPNNTVGVTGTFWQATQPVSGTVTANAGTNLNTSALALDATMTNRTQKVQITDGTRDGTVKAASTAALATDTAVVVAISPNNTVGVTGTFWQATQPVSAASLPLPTGAATAAKQPALGTAGSASADVITIQGAASMTAVKVDGSAVTQPVSFTPPTLTKGTQGATGYSVQDLKDAGRNQTNFFMAIQIVSTSTDALMSLTGYKSGAAVGATTTPAVVTAAKTYRLQSITLDYTTIVTTPGSVRFTLRANTGGVVAITSPAVCIWEVGEPTGIAPVAGKKFTVTIPIPDGIEFAAGTGIGLSMVGLNTVGAAAVVGYGRATLNGYEY